jgi:hypothetical protein
MFEFKLQKWFDIFLELIEFPTNFRSSTHLNFIQTIRLGKGKVYCALGQRSARLLAWPSKWASSAWASSPLLKSQGTLAVSTGRRRPATSGDGRR